MQGLTNLLSLNQHVKKLFLFGLLLKIFLLFLFSSQYNTDLFYPFISSVSMINLNPWQYYWENNLNLDAFPYHSLMLLLLVPFALLGEFIGTGASFIKIPLLLADLGVLYIFFKLFPYKQKQIFLFYALNPIIFYSIYVHSQLDIIPTAFLFTSIYLLTLQKFKMAALFFGLALATKSHVIIALPLILLDILQNSFVFHSKTTVKVD